ncbi:MAG TPA: efflux RND transporter periplasmic adaptor subunit, partial [Phycisphaerae bacterium]|nr:efflux RND transporter periplasmic adaptor subunit [Phycisphaerae bacterium]
MAWLWDHAAWWMPRLLRASAQASVLIGLVLAAQWLLGRRLPARGRHALWLLVLARLALPATPPAGWSVHNVWALAWSGAAGQPEAPARRDPHTPVARPAAGPPGRAVARAPADELLPPVAGDSVGPTGGVSAPPAAVSTDDRSAQVLGALALAWAVVAAGLLGRLLAANARFRRRLRRQSQTPSDELAGLIRACAAEVGLRRCGRVILTPAVRVPALFGVLRPRLLLPVGLPDQLDDKELRHVLLHELTHRKRHDVPLDWLATLLVVVHWPNPLVWLALRRMQADRELACDEAVLARTGGREAQAYGRTVLKLLEGLSLPRRVAGVIGVVERAGQTRRRITMITNFRQGRRWASAAGLVLLLALGAVALTDARGEPGGAGNTAAPAAVKAAESQPAPTGDPNAAKAKGLGRNIERLSFQSIALKDVLQFLREYGDLNLHANWRALQAVGIEQSAKISLDVRNVTVERALDLVLHDVAGAKTGEAAPASQLRAGVVLVSTRGQFEADRRSRCGQEFPAWREGAQEAGAALRQKLQRDIPRLSFAETALKDVLQFLREYSGANVHVNWSALEAVGAGPDTKLSLDLKNVTVHRALEAVLADVSPAGVDGAIVYAIDRGVLEISTRQDLAARATAEGLKWLGGVTALPPGHVRELSFTTAGRVAEVHVRAGDLVKAGQELARLDDAAEREQLALLKAEADETTRIRAAEVQLAAKRVELERATKLANTGAVSAEEPARAKLDVQVGELSVELARSELNKARHRYQEAAIRLDRMRLVSPIDGWVMSVSASVGEAVAALAPVVRVVKAGNDPLHVQVDVPIHQVAGLRPGQAAIVQFLGDRGPVRGKLLYLSPTVAPESHTLRVTVEIP